MPQTTALLMNPHAAKAYRYIADAPTTTTQRLKSMVSGGLPTFFDVSNAFTAQAMDEDNLMDQLVAAGRRMVFMGDATWANLFPTQFNVSLPFPCFNVKDLDTVDDGIWEHLLPTLRRPADWDVLVAHYLGVDHAGHSVGVESSRMAEKLRQMDDHVAAIVDVLRDGAASGGPYADALLLISGDHGQTLSGDHGGGSPEEVDSVLIAVDLSALHRAEHEHKEDGDYVEGSTGMPTKINKCRENCTCGDDGDQCADDLPQIDLVPTLAAMMDLPMPFVNLGKLNPELWSLAGRRCSANAGGGAGAQARALGRATGANARQVHAYINTYADHRATRFPAAALHKLNAAFDRLVFGDAACDAASDCGVSAHLQFLVLAHDLAMQAWAQFGDVSMVAGLALFVAAVVYHGVAAWQVVQPRLLSGGEAVLAGSLWAGVAVQCGGLFSFFYLLSEGQLPTMCFCSHTVPGWR